jgi:hypothetical protein
MADMNLCYYVVHRLDEQVERFIAIGLGAYRKTIRRSWHGLKVLSNSNLASRRDVSSLSIMFSAIMSVGSYLDHQSVSVAKRPFIYLNFYDNCVAHRETLHLYRPCKGHR